MPPTMTFNSTTSEWTWGQEDPEDDVNFNIEVNDEIRFLIEREIFVDIGPAKKGKEGEIVESRDRVDESQKKIDPPYSLVVK